ncbi:MAG: SH3 domain-containing protein, partial [Anaerolineaceae bacterium]|nr:SH3 domain-containing protein [Anaerolineaceae bacterium]
PGIYNVTYYINGVDVQSASYEVTASDELIAGSFDCEIIMGIYNNETEDWKEYTGSIFNLNDLDPDESFSFALNVQNRMSRAVIPTVTASVNGEELSWDNAIVEGKDNYKFFATGQIMDAGTYDVIYYINGIRVQSASFDIVDEEGSGFNDLYDCRIVMGIYDSDIEDWNEYSGRSYVLSDLKPNESFAFALYMENKTNKTLTPRVTAMINGEKLTWRDMDIKPYGDLSDYATGYMDKAGTYEVEFFIDGTKAGRAVFEITSSAPRSVPGSFDASFVMGIYDSRTDSWYDYSNDCFDRSDLRANEEFSFALKVTNTSEDEIEPSVSYVVNEKKQSLPPVKIRPGRTQIFFVTDELTEDGLYDIWFFVNDAEVAHNTVEIQGEWMVDQKGDVGVLLYDKPGYNGNVLRSLLNGTLVVKLETRTVGPVVWANVRTREGQTGWIPAAALGKPR